MTISATTGPTLDLMFGGAQHPITLRMPSVDDVFGLVIPEYLRSPERMQHLGPAEIQSSLATVDGAPAELAHARAIRDSADAFARYSTARTAWIDDVCQAGVALAECPGCGEWEAELQLVAYGVGLHRALWPLSHGGYLALPSLAERRPRGHRPSGVELTSGLRFELPSARLGNDAPSRGAWRSGDTSAPEARAWQEWTSDDADPLAERALWNEHVPGFCAVLRLSVSLETLGEVEPPAPPALMRLPYADFAFLDNLHYLAHDLDVPADHGLGVRCERCGQAFLPLL